MQSTEFLSQTFVFHGQKRWLLLAIENENEPKTLASSGNRQLLTESWTHGLALEVAKSEKGEKVQLNFFGYLSIT